MCFRGGNAMHTNPIYDEHHTLLGRSLSSLTTPRPLIVRNSTHAINTRPPPRSPWHPPHDCAQLPSSSRRKSRASITSATLPWTRLHSSRMYVTGEERRRLKRNPKTNQMDEDGRSIRGGRWSMRNSAEIVASLSLPLSQSQSHSVRDRDREQHRLTTVDGRAGGRARTPSQRRTRPISRTSPASAAPSA
ncbi:hypothetical protein FIBSPDRAFT_465929 [Athelia psychrophila]|uniref:Uncharacterized protein n=1 Tax=Athelia psychrophila TaxID=1759441 RepID=A0A166LJA2_9AGAM|nr:hypothetical protein FIBSPDRAFT_465929 [Fibularhizoctonia sp. CBS 109695]